MMTRKDRASEVVKVSVTGFTLVALAVYFSVILATLDDLSTATFRTANTSLPPQLAHSCVALGIINQTTKIEVEHHNS
jgi:hypothetical protein